MAISARKNSAQAMPAPLSPQLPLILFGGSFDPVHNAHIDLAHDIATLMQSPVSLLPTFQSPLKKTSQTTATERLTLLQYAIADYPELSINTYEMAQTGKACYTIDTLTHFRQTLQDSTPLIFVMGMDSFNQLNQWRAWQSLLDHCHLIIAHRSGEIQDNAEVATFTQTAVADTPMLLRQRPSGCVFHYKFKDFCLSSSIIRAALARGEPPSELHPAVYRYIAEHSLYRSPSPNV